MMKVRHIGPGIAGLILIAIFIWLSCNGGGGEEGSRVITAPCQELQEFKRFRYTYTYKIDSPKPEGPVDEGQLGEPPFAIPPTADSFLIEQVYEGSFVATDRFLMAVSTPSEEDAGVVELLFVGDQSWVRTGAGSWLSGMGRIPNAFAPQRVCDTVLGTLDLTGLPSTPETINGLETQHFKVEGASLEVAATLFGAESDMGRLAKLYSVDAWITDKGWPARVEAKSTGTFPSGRQMLFEVGLEIKDVNKGDIKIESPQ